MSNIRMDSAKVRPCVQDLTAISRILEENSQKIGNTITALKEMQSSATEPICRSIRGVSDAVLTRAANMKSLAEALQVIVDAYDNTEKQLAQTGLSSEGSHESDKIADWLRSIIQKIKEFFHWGESTEPAPEEEPAGVTRAEEKAHDQYMQGEIFNLLSTDAFSQETWNKATVEERKQILESYMAQVAAIYGVTVVSSINFYNGASGSRGSYNHGSRTVSVNENYLSRTDSYQIMQTVIHELRHAYQHSAVDDPDSYNVSPETIRVWEENLTPGNYKSTSNGYTYEEYVSQPVEWDAKNFAKQYTDVAGVTPEYEGSWGN